MEGSRKVVIVAVVATMVALQLMVPAPAVALSLEHQESSLVTVSRLGIRKLLQGDCVSSAFGSCDLKPCCPPLFSFMEGAGTCVCLEVQF